MSISIVILRSLDLSVAVHPLKMLGQYQKRWPRSSAAPLRRFLFIRTRNKSSISARTRAKLLSAGRRAAIRLVAFIRRPARRRGRKVYHPQTKFISVSRASRIKRCNNGARSASGTRRKSQPRGDRRQRGPRPTFDHPFPTEDLIARSITLHPYGASFSFAAYPSCRGRYSYRGPKFDCS